MTERRFLGITVLGDYVLNEGVDGVLANMEKCGATAVACNPTVTAPAAEGEGSFQPPDDAGSSPRLFDRPLWGRRSLWVRSGASYEPNASFYQDTPYSPRRANDLTSEHGHIIGDFVRGARAAGLQFRKGLIAAAGDHVTAQHSVRAAGGDAHRVKFLWIITDPYMAVDGSVLLCQTRHVENRHALSHHMRSHGQER